MERRHERADGRRARRFLGRVWGRLRGNRGLINTTDVMVAAGAAVILASAVATVGTEGLDQAKYGKAGPDAVSIGTAMVNFFKDTGKWPGQAEIAGQTNLAPLRYLSTGAATAANLPAGLTKLAHGSSGTCKGNSGTGAVNKAFDAVASPGTANFLNINDYLIRKPSDTNYPNWKGPYLAAEITADPWDKVWVINVTPLFCAELITGTDTDTAAQLGYGWILSGGSNREITTSVKSAKLDPTGEDVGVDIGKLVQRQQGFQ